MQPLRSGVVLLVQGTRLSYIMIWSDHRQNISVLLPLFPWYICFLYTEFHCANQSDLTQWSSCLSQLCFGTPDMHYHARMKVFSWCRCFSQFLPGVCLSLVDAWKYMHTKARRGHCVLLYHSPTHFLKVSLALNLRLRQQATSSWYSPLSHTSKCLSNYVFLRGCLE